MSFFPPDSELPEEDEFSHPRDPRAEAAEDELPVLIPQSLVLARTEYVAIILTALAVHSDGLEFRLQRRLRRHDLSMTEWWEIADVFMEHSPGARAESAKRLRYGLVLGDGTKVVESPFAGRAPEATDGAADDPPSLTRRGSGGGGGTQTYEMQETLWLWPTPPDGRIEVVVQWPAVDIDETHVWVDASTLSAVRGQVRPVWDDPNAR